MSVIDDFMNYVSSPSGDTIRARGETGCAIRGRVFDMTLHGPPGEQEVHLAIALLLAQLKLKDSTEELFCSNGEVYLEIAHWIHPYVDPKTAQWLEVEFGLEPINEEHISRPKAPSNIHYLNKI